MYHLISDNTLARLVAEMPDNTQTMEQGAALRTGERGGTEAHVRSGQSHHDCQTGGS